MTAPVATTTVFDAAAWAAENMPAPASCTHTTCAECDCPEPAVDPCAECASSPCVCPIARLRPEFNGWW
jgi:hypothetical protein